MEGLQRSETLAKQQPQKEQQGSSGHYEAPVCHRIQFAVNTEKSRYKLTVVPPLRIPASTKHTCRKRASTSQGLISTKLLSVSKVSNCLGEGNRGNFSGQSQSSPSLLVSEATASNLKQWKEIIVGLGGPVETTQANFISVFWTRAIGDRS